MSRTTNIHSVDECCIMCLNSFGIQQAREARICANIKCRRRFCTECVQIVRVCNGNDRRFQCMYCLKEYDPNESPEKDDLLQEQLWQQATIKYGIKRTRQLLSTNCIRSDLVTDIDCRRRHLMNFTLLSKRYPDDALSNSIITDVQNMTNQLSEIIQCVQDAKHDNLDIYKEGYRKAISNSNDDNDIGSFYIHLCEDLQLEISNAECDRMFPGTRAKVKEWMHEQGSSEEFEPKIPVLLKMIEQDLMNQRSNTRSAVRIKIGVIGYTSSGKSSVINRLLDMNSLEEDGAAPVSASKSTYFPLQYDRKEPFIDPFNPERKTLITFVDIQGLDKNRIVNNTELQAGNYVDDIGKADCDIYLVIYDEELSEEQQTWIYYIEEGLNRKCLLVRSKVDIHYLQKFYELSETYFAVSDENQRAKFRPTIMKQIREDCSVDSRNVYLVACYYTAPNSDAAKLLELKEQLFDFPDLLDGLACLASDACAHRIHALAHRMFARAINTIFRRGYVLNVMKYKVAAGFASIIPFGDQLPRRISRDGIRDAFGIDDNLRQYITEFSLVVYNYKLQTSVFKGCVEMHETTINSKFDPVWIGKAAGTALIVGGGLTDDVLRVAGPAATVLSGAARTAFTVATIGIGVVISAGVSAWSAIDSGKHIFSYTNRICNDLIMISNPLLMAIIEHEREKIFDRSILDINDGQCAE